ncbi:predicted protein [Lichtheimia corymbifera JMRC:FSU:9682]|uniref:Uncharacterized protein n=1 Tax=Lichtheimia corymbifera JMRC:FSU:9682 TaxID=1263082 RepID=A0A068SDD4_9FUNG|nr:predicted protein [Lichtheimia corymbifera JMRC:FSU:9682]
MQAIFTWLSCDRNDRGKEIQTAAWKRKHISSIIVFAMVMDGGMQSSAVTRKESRLVICRIVSRNDGSCHVDPAEDDDDDDGLDEVDKKAYLFGEGWLIAMDDLGILESMHIAAISQPWMKDVYDGRQPRIQ